MKKQISSTMQKQSNPPQSQIELLWFKVTEFFKKFWMFFAALGGLATYLIIKNKKSTDNLPSEIRSFGDKFANDVNVIRKNEQDAAAKEEKEHQEKTAAIKKKYDAEKEKLDENTKAAAEKIFEQHKDNPEALAQELSKVTGFKVILPQD